jgi:hypothetical protein
VLTGAWVIKRPWLLCVLVSICSIALLPSGLRAYLPAVHLGFTIWLAERAGFTSEEALEIAKHDNATDDDPSTKPGWTTSAEDIRRRSSYHFVSTERLGELRKAALACSRGNLRPRYRDIGYYLHALEDSYAHRGFGPVYGHIFYGFGPDEPWSDAAAFLEMIRAKFDALLTLRLQCGEQTSPPEADAKREFAKVIAQYLDPWLVETRQAGSRGGDRGPQLWHDLQLRIYEARADFYLKHTPQVYWTWREGREKEGWR